MHVLFLHLTEQNNKIFSTIQYIILRYTSKEKMELKNKFREKGIINFPNGEELVSF